MQPGDTITPGQQPAPPSSSPVPAPTPEQAPQPSPTPDPVPATPEPQSNWSYAQTTAAPGIYDEPQPAYGTETVSWSASEFVAHQKTAGWFAGLGFVVAALAVGIYFFTKEVFSPIMVAVLGVTFGIFAARQPQVLSYSVGPNGITIGQKSYPYESIKSFSVIEEGGLHSITFLPLQRFMPSITVYCEPADEDKILDVLSGYLPFEEAKRDAVGSLMRRVRF